MNMRSMRTLIVVAAVLVVGVVVLDLAEDRGERADGAALLPAFDGRINDVTRVALEYPDTTVTVSRSGDGWVVEEKDGYAADTGTLRQVLIALRDAQKLEPKTANPEMHGRLGLADPGTDGSDSVRMTVRGEGFEHALVIGDVAQQSYRYVRFAGEDQTWLIDQNPEVPEDATGWLAPDLVDIGPSDVQSVSIVHADGEAIHFAKGARDDDNYTVADIPEGRELTYAGVVNGIAGALRNLDLDEVRRPPEELPDAATTTTWTTFDGLEVTAESYGIDGDSWISLSAAVSEPPVASAPASDGGAADESAVSGDQAPAADAEATDEVEDAAAEKLVPEDSQQPGSDAEVDAAAEEAPTPREQADAINETVNGWLYQVPDHKLRLMQRRWDDILKAPPEAEGDDDE